MTGQWLEQELLDAVEQRPRLALTGAGHHRRVPPDTALVTNTATGQLQWLEIGHRAHARVEDRAKRFASAAVGGDGETVAAMARRLGIGWRTSMRAVAEVGIPMVGDQQRLAGVSGIGVDYPAGK